MKALVINCGSSSLKFQLFDMASERVLARGMVDRIGGAESAGYTYEAGATALAGELNAPDHETALAHMVAMLTHPEHGAVGAVTDIDAVGHRVVHGGKTFVAPALIDAQVIAAVEEQSPLAPLHNPANLAGILAAQHRLPQAPHVAVFDTSFHQTMPRHAYLYALPYELYERHHLRRYGFHGTSHLFVARRGAAMLRKPFAEFTAITCHLGNGCSMAAIRNGKSVDTTMGLTPLEGLMMGSRSGDIDPGIIFFLAREAGLDLAQLDSLLNRKSGLLGISGLSNDVRTLIKAADEGEERAALALEMFAYRVKKYIGAFMAALGGCDAIIFTGGIGENATSLRRQICSGLEALGICLDPAHNDAARDCEADISAPQSKVSILVAPTNEELEIAQETARIVQQTHETKQPVETL